MNCFECIHHDTIPGNAHLLCKHPEGKNPANMLLAYFRQQACNPNLGVLGIVVNEHGLQNGWVFWPLNFDSIWIESCNGFQMKGRDNG
jgi:hypothetical protein